jgi:hypothetical protein
VSTGKTSQLSYKEILPMKSRLLHSTPLRIFLFLFIFLTQRFYYFSKIGVQIESDSYSYRTIRQDGRLFSFQDISSDSLRPFPVNFLYSLLINDPGRVYFQILLASLAWSLLIFTALKCLNETKHTRYVWLIGYTLSLSPALVYRDLTIMPESLTLSVTLLFITSIMIMNLKKTYKSISFFFITLSFLVIQRPTFSLLALIFLFVLSLLKLRKGGKEFFKKNRIFLVITILISIIGLGYNTQNNQDDWPKNIASTYPVYKDAFIPGLQMWENNPFHINWREYYVENGLPECASQFSKFSGPNDYSVGVFGECQDASMWLKNEFWRIQLGAMIFEPLLVIKSIIWFGAEAFVPAPTTYRLEQLGVPSYLEFPTFEIVGMSKYGGKNYLISWNSFLFSFVLFMYLAFRVRGYISLQKSNIEFILAGSLALVISISFTVLIMPSDVYRHVLPMNYLLTFLLFYVLVPLHGRTTGMKSITKKVSS